MVIYIFKIGLKFLNNTLVFVFKQLNISISATSYRKNLNFKHVSNAKIVDLNPKAFF